MTISEPSMSGRRASSRISVVDDVVVEQRLSVQQFERGPSDDHRRVARLGIGDGAASGDETPVTEGGSQALSAGAHQTWNLSEWLGERGIEIGPTLRLRDEERLEHRVDTAGDAAQRLRGYSHAGQARRSGSLLVGLETGDNFVDLHARGADALTAGADQLRCPTYPLGELVDVDIG